MPDNDKKGNTLSFLSPFFFFWEINWGNANKECRKQEINMQNKLDILFQLFQAIGGPNHTMMEYSLLSRCNHKARLDGPKAYHLTQHPWLDSRSQIIFRRCDSVHTKTSLEQSQIIKARSNSSSSNSLKGFGITTSIEAGKVALI